MNRPLELENFAQAVAQNSWANFKIHFPKITRPCPKIIISRRMKTTAGYCTPSERLVKLCFDLLDQYTKNFETDIIPHELGHQIAYDLYGIGLNNGARIDWHGKDWQRIMILSGYPIDRCHDMKNARHIK